MDTLQALWLTDAPGRLAEAEREELGGRTSGTADWRAKRDELGLQATKKPAIRGRSISKDVYTDEIQSFDRYMRV